MIHKRIEKVIPFVSENFITYPLWEEGKYIPFLNFWQIAKTEKENKNLDEIIECLKKKHVGYEIDVNKEISNNIIHFKISIFPDFKDNEELSYDFYKKDWSIEEMVEIVNEFLLKKY